MRQPKFQQGHWWQLGIVVVRAENLSLPEVRKNLVLWDFHAIGFFGVGIACLEICLANRKKKDCQRV